jgi:hypothetical protein
MLSIGPKNICSTFCFGAEIKDGVKIQDGTQKLKILSYPNGQKSPYFENLFFVLLLLSLDFGAILDFDAKT